MARKKRMAIKPHMRKHFQNSGAGTSSQKMGDSYNQLVDDWYMGKTPQLKFSYRWEEMENSPKTRINCFSRLQLIPAILDELSEEDKKKLKGGIFGPLISMSTKLKMSNQLIHFMLMREVKTERRNSMWFRINDVLLRFGLTEFADITALSCSDEFFKADEKCVNVDMKDVVGVARCPLQKLEEYFFKEPKDSPYKYKMALIIFIEGVLVSKDKKTNVFQQTLNLVNDLEAFRNYPWGRLAFTQTKKHLQSCEAGKERPSGGYNIGGFPLALQIFVFASIPKIANVFATLLDGDVRPLCLRWVSKSGKGGKPFSGYAEIKGIVSTLKKSDIHHMVEEMDDDDHDWWDSELEDVRIDYMFDVGFTKYDVTISRPSTFQKMEEPTSVQDIKVNSTSGVEAATEDDDFVSPPKRENEGAKTVRAEETNKGKRKVDNISPTAIPSRSSKRINKATDREPSIEIPGKNEQAKVDKKEKIVEEGGKSTHNQKEDTSKIPKENVHAGSTKTPGKGEVVKVDTKEKNVDKGGKSTQTEKDDTSKSSKRSDKTTLPEPSSVIFEEAQALKVEGKRKTVDEGGKSTHTQTSDTTKLNTEHPDWVEKIMQKLESIQQEQKELAEKVENQGILIEDLTNYARDLGILYEQIDTTVYTSYKRTENKITNLAKDILKTAYDGQCSEHASKDPEPSTKEILDDAKVNELAGDSPEDVKSDEPARRVCLRIQRDSKYMKTPYKRNVKLPKEPNMSMLQLKERHKLYNWLKNKDDKGSIRGYVNNISRDSIQEILQPTGWIKDKAIDELMMHLRKEIVDMPDRFSKVAVLSIVWSRAYNRTTYTKYTETSNGNPDFNKAMFAVISGDSPQMFGKPLYDVDVIYSLYNIMDSHWIALEIDLRQWCIYVYDPMVMYVKDDKLQSILEPLAVMFPQVLRAHGKHSHLGDKLESALKVVRKTGLNINADGGSCGIFTVKYIQYLASGRSDLSAICDDFVQACREKLANVVFTRDWTRWFDDM